MSRHPPPAPPETPPKSPQQQAEYGTFSPLASPLTSWLRPKKSESDDLEVSLNEDKNSTYYEGTAPASVLLFGLSANPPTGSRGHKGIVSFLAAQNKWDEIWVMPVYKHMHAKNSLLLDFEDRMQMCKLNFHSSNTGNKNTTDTHTQIHSRTRVKVVRLEKEVADHYIDLAAARGKGPESVKVGTIDVVLYAKERLPQTEFALTLGTDTYNDIKRGKWKRGRELLNLVSVAVMARPGVPYGLQEDDIQNPRIEFYNVPTLGEVSSTAVRKTADMRLLREALDPKVLEYIREKGLYTIGRLEGCLRTNESWGRTGGEEGEGGGGGGGRGRRGGWWGKRQWVWLGSLIVCTGLFLALGRKVGWRKMERGLLRVEKVVIRVEKDAKKG